MSSIARGTAERVVTVDRERNAAPGDPGSRSMTLCCDLQLERANSLGKIAKWGFGRGAAKRRRPRIDPRAPYNTEMSIEVRPRFVRAAD